MQPYVLGDADPELRRLTDQARLFGDLTEQMFQHAGLRAGMRVLDVGCGAGDVSFLGFGDDGLWTAARSDPDPL